MAKKPRVLKPAGPAVPAFPLPELTKRRSDTVQIAMDVLMCAKSFEAQALLLGNVRADEIAQLCVTYLEWVASIDPVTAAAVKLLLERLDNAPPSLREIIAARRLGP